MEDEKIIGLYFRRSDEAIPQTALKYGSRCKAVAYNILHSHEDSEECVNDTYLAVYFEGDQEGVPMYVQLVSFPNHVCILTGTNHAVG